MSRGLVGHVGPNFQSRSSCGTAHIWRPRCCQLFLLAEANFGTGVAVTSKLALISV